MPLEETAAPAPSGEPIPEGKPKRVDNRGTRKWLDGTIPRTCICGGGAECRAITKYYCEQEGGAHFRGGYCRVPGSLSGPDGPNNVTERGREETQKRKMTYKCQGVEYEKHVKNMQRWVSFIHFPDAFLALAKVIGRQEAVDIEKHRDLFRGKNWLKLTHGANAGKMYAGPLQSLEEAKKMKEEHEGHIHARDLTRPSSPPPAPLPTSAPATPQQAPPQHRQRGTEKKVRREGRDIQRSEEAAEAAAIELARLREDIQTKRDELDAVKNELDQERRERKAEKSSWAEERRKLKAEARNLSKEIRNLKELGRVIKRVMKSLNPMTLASDDWHRDNSEAAKVLFGVKDTWKETVVFLQCCFPDLDTSKRAGKTVSDFEGLLLTLMRVRRGFELKTLHYIIGRKDSTVSGYVGRWMPLLGNRGKCMYQLDMDFTHDFISKADADRFGVPHGNGDGPDTYFDCTVTKEYKQVGMEKVAVAIDGKCFRTETPRSNSALNRAMQDSKTSGSAFLTLALSTQSGLVVEASDLVCGRASEMKLNEEMGRVNRIGNLQTIEECEDDEEGESEDDEEGESEGEGEGGDNDDIDGEQYKGERCAKRVDGRIVLGKVIDFGEDEDHDLAWVVRFEEEVVEYFDGTFGFDEDYKRRDLEQAVALYQEFVEEE